MHYFTCRVTDFHLELEQEVILSLVEFFKNMSLRFQSGIWQQMDFTLYPPPPDPPFAGDTTSANTDLTEFFESNGNQNYFLPRVIPIGAPWQQIHLLARKQRKIYVELLDMAPIKFTLRLRA